ncbi:HNH endonuclease, partial [Methanobrevibacter sp. OttesenSCG-928-I08]|nr:HNH endonuclease [Methanobrevibacter sp. OttesenSCG-928-I08]
ALPVFLKSRSDNLNKNDKINELTEFNSFIKRLESFGLVPGEKFAEEIKIKLEHEVKFNNVSLNNIEYTLDLIIKNKINNLTSQESSQITRETNKRTKEFSTLNNSNLDDFRENELKLNNIKRLEELNEIIPKKEELINYGLDGIAKDTAIEELKNLIIEQENIQNKMKLYDDEKSEKNQRKNIPPGIRHDVLVKYDYRCAECGTSKENAELEIDHIIPVAKGGSNDIDNLQVLCRDCNRGKSDKIWD